MPCNTQSTWADTTDIVCSTGPVRVKSLKVTRLPTATGVVYIQLFNATSATPGATAPNDVIEVPFGEPETPLKVNFHGKYYGTGLCWFCATTATGATAPTTTELPIECRLDWV